ncbi:caspase family protein [Rhizobium laguerreae]
MLIINRRQFVSLAAYINAYLFSSLAMAEEPALFKLRKTACLIGNSAYTNIKPLDGPSEDISLLEKKFTEMGFTPMSVWRDVAIDKMSRRLRQFSAEARVSDIAVLYYSGHGLEINGENFLLPVDAEIETDEDVAYETVSAALALQAVSRAKQLGVLILDACRDNPFKQKMKMQGGSTVQYPHGLAPLVASKNVLILFAAAPGELAAAGENGEESPFAKALASHVGEPGLKLTELVTRVRDDVSTKTAGSQSPHFSGSFGELYLVPPALPLTTATSPVVVDVQFADASDETVGDKLNQSSEYDYRDVTNVTGSNDGLVFPNTDYFVTRSERGRAFINAEQVGYFAPPEGIGIWYPSFPILDLVARRAIEEDVVLSEIVVDVEYSRPDKTPYTNVICPSDQFCELVLVNEGWSKVKEAVFDYDIIGFVEPDIDILADQLKSRPDKSFKYGSRTGSFSHHINLDLSVGAADYLSDFKMYQFAFDNPPWQNGAEGPIPAKGAPNGYKEWIANHEGAYSGPSHSNDEASGLWVVGRLTVTPLESGTAQEVIDVCSPIPISAPEGLGGGAIEYSQVKHIKLRTKGDKYSVSRGIGYLLDRDTKTYRGLVPIMADMTSIHKVRISLFGDGGRNLYTGKWFEIMIFVPKEGKRETDDYLKEVAKAGGEN